MRFLPLTLCFVLMLTGCAKDDRVKRAASLSTVKAEQAKADMAAAATDTEKVKIASDFLDSEIPLLQGVEDYLFERNPSTTTPAAPKP